MRERRPFWFLRRRRSEIAADVEAELRDHLERRTEALVARGLSADEARQEARRRFGDLAGTERYCRDQLYEKERRMRRSLSLEEIAQDLKIALRSLRRAPALALTIVLSVGLGIGATAGIFAVVDAALLRPLPYPNPAQLVRIFTDAPPYRFRFSAVDYQALAAQQTTFTSVAGFADRPMTYADGQSAERLRGREVTASYFATLGITPALGRAFTDAEARPGGRPSVVISDHFWRQRLGAAPDVVGRTIRLDSVPYVITGVLPPATGPLEFQQDYLVAAQWAPPRRKGPFFITAIGRLPSVSALGAATSELHAINRRLFPLWKASYQDEKATWAAMDLKTYLAGNFRTIARVTFATAGLLWLIACVNASNLLVARASARRRELAVRAALGASRARLMRYLLAESAVLAVAAAALGATLAWLAITAARTAGAPYIPRAEEIALGGRTLAVLAAATLGSVLLFGLIPALQAGAGARVDEGLRSSSRSSTGSRSVRRVRGVLVALQFAFATPLLVAAGLLLASLGHLARVNLGFDTRNVLTAAVMLPAPEYRDDGAVVTFWDRLRDGLARVPGVSGVAFTDSRPPEDAGNQNNFDLEDYPSGPGQQPVTTWVDVSPEYFGLFGLRLTEGRLFDARDTTTTSPSIVIVDEAWARRFFPGRSALGKRLKGGGCSTCDWTTIVGVVSSVTYDGLHNGQQGIVYTPMTTQGEAVAQSFSGLTRYVMLRSSVSSAAILPHVRRVLHDLDPGVPLTRVATIDELVEQSLEQPRGLSVIVAIVAAVALALSVVGVYGVMTHLVQQQAKDISIRLALGGTPRGVAALVLRRGLTLVAWGVAGGAAASAGLARVLESLLFEVPITDPVTISTVALLLLATAAVACGIPAARAAAAAPAEVLRAD